MHKKEKTTGRLERLAALLLSLAVLVSLVPVTAEAVSEYGMTIMDNVNIRPGMDTSDYLDRLPLGWVGKILETIEGSTYTWYKVETKLPVFPNREATQGYLRGDVFRPFTQAEEAGWLVAKPQVYGGAASATQAPTGGTVTLAPAVTEPPVYQAPSGYVRIILANTNLREQPESSKIFAQIPKGTILPYYGGPVQKGTYQWQYVFFEDQDEYGYIRSDCYEYTTQTGEATAKPSAAAVTATPTPQATATYALTRISGANLRQTPGGIAVTALSLHAQLNILEGPANGWYKAQSGNYTGYVQEEHIRVLSQAEATAWLNSGTLPADMSSGTTPTPTPTPGPAPASSGYLSITLPGTNLRATPGGTSLFKFDVGTILPYTGAPVYHSGYYWAYVAHDRSGLKGYVRSDCYVITDGGEGPVATVTPTPTTPGAGQGTVRLTLGGVNLRQTPGGPVLATMPRGLELGYFNAPTYFGGYFWVYVYDQASSQYGYVRSDCYEIVEGLPQPTGGPTPAPTPTVPATGYLKLVKGGVNLRNAPAGDTLAQLDRDLELAYFSVSSALGYTWYQVDSPKGRGWVRSDVIQITKGPGVPGPDPTPTSTVPTPTPPVGEMGYILTTKSAINLRQAPGSSSILGRVDKDLVLALTSPVVSHQGYNWYQVNSGGRTGFLRGDCVRPLTAAEVIDYLNGKMPGPTPPPGGDPAAAGYVLTTMTSVNVRESPSLDARTLGQIAAAGGVFPYESTVTAGGRTWFKIIYQNQAGYLLGSTARMMTVQEYQDYLATRPTPSPTPAPTPTPDPADLSSTAITRMDKVLLRQAPGGKTLTTLYKQGTILALQGAVQQADNYTWHAVRTLGVNGWIRGDMIRILTKDEEKALNQTGDPDAPPTASYRTLEIGSSGEDVRRLQQELSRIGYLEAAYISGTFDTPTGTAVRAYQKAVGLFVDGIAGDRTQHKLFNTVPEETYEPGTGGTVSPTLYPVEKVDWVTGDISTFWSRGETAILTDVRTKISFRVKRHEGGLHADVEPLTAADTAAMCRVYGVNNAQEILEKNLYQRRPVWISLKGRSFAASIYGVPHNYPAGDKIPDNNFNGQFCVHFLNSKIHSSGRVDSDHQKAIEEAYNAAPARK